MAEAKAPKPPPELGDGLDALSCAVEPNAAGVPEANALKPPVAAGLDSAGFSVDPRADPNVVGVDANALKPPDVVAGF